MGVLEARFDSSHVRRLWNPKDPGGESLRAVEDRFLPPFPAGHTPLAAAPTLARALGVKELWIKCDSANPSGSLKDRASHLMAAEALRLGERQVVCASTGNAASATAAACAAAGLEALIFVPSSAPRAKLVQMLACGARVVTVRGTYDDAFRLSLEYTAARGGLNRNTAYHPLTLEGKKTVGLEIFAQLGRVPDWVVVPGGDGVILAAVHKAFRDLWDAGIISHIPRLLLAQAEGSAALHRYVETGQFEPHDSPHTVADSLSVAVPSNAHLAVRAVAESEGISVTVPDSAILEAQRELARSTGLFGEPAAATGLAALKKAVPTGGDARVGPGDSVVLLLTGHGLKDIESAGEGLPLPSPIEPVLEEVQ